MPHIRGSQNFHYFEPCDYKVIQKNFTLLYEKTCKPPKLMALSDPASGVARVLLYFSVTYKTNEETQAWPT
jgi:hypothetical protein